MLRLKLTNIIFFSFSLILSAQNISYNQEFMVNNESDDYQMYPDICKLIDGGFVISWYSWNLVDKHTINGQIYNNDGSKRGNLFSAFSLFDSQGYPSSSGLLDGGFIICRGNPDIYGQLFDIDGLKRDNKFKVNNDSNYYADNPSVCSLSNGGYAICWEGYKQDINTYDIYCQIYNSDYSRYGSKFVVNTYIKNNQQYPNISTKKNNGFIICWYSININGNGVYGQLYNNDGSKRGTEFEVISNIDFTHPRVCDLQDSNFVVCWFGKNNNNIYDVYGQILNYNGLKQGNIFKVNVTNISNDLYPDIFCLNDSGFVVCWQREGSDGNLGGIFAQLFTENGLKRGVEFQVNSYINSGQSYPKINGLNENRFIICWQSFKQDYRYTSIYAKYYLQNPIIHQLESFSLLNPDDDQTLQTTNFAFNWSKTSTLHINFPWELEYKIYLYDNNDFIHSQIISGIYDTTYVVDSLKPGTTYFWKVLAKNIAGDSLWSSETNLFYVSENATVIKHQNSNNKLQRFELYPNFPNPFNPETTIKYQLPVEQTVYQVKVKIYNALGQLITTLISEPKNPGLHTVKWNGKNSSGAAMPSGVYYCLVQAGENKAVQKMLLVR